MWSLGLGKAQQWHKVEEDSLQWESPRALDVTINGPV
eukprot:jgi/Hompol1/1006/HPOL_001401-RA